jgi:hypothetical protein
LTAVPVRLAEIRAAGAEVALDSDVLRVRAPRGALTDGQRARCQAPREDASFDGGLAWVSEGAAP